MTKHLNDVQFDFILLKAPRSGGSKKKGPVGTAGTTGAAGAAG